VLCRRMYVGIGTVRLCDEGWGLLTMPAVGW
jgi:hypothetical protein